MGRAASAVPTARVPPNRSRRERSWQASRRAPVVAVGSATIAAFIGAGGFGEPISTGLSLDDVPTILHGAIPAAGLALVIQGAFAALEHVLLPKGLRSEH